MKTINVQMQTVGIQKGETTKTETEQVQFMLMPAKPGACQECAVKHEPNMPHNRDSAYYQVQFHSVHGRYPTWADALSHCSDEMKAHWIHELTKRGIDVNGGEA